MSLAEVITFPALGFDLGQGSAGQSVHGSELSLPGIESVLEFRGLRMNVREWVDTYVIKDILGMDDPDLNDQREDNPSDDGETPLDSKYRGRTLVLQGFIRAKTVWKLNDMFQALRRAFADVSQESPLVFRAGNPQADAIIYCKKSQKNQWGNTQQHANHFQRDFSITLRASNPRFLSYTQEYLYMPLAASPVNFSTFNRGTYTAQPVITIHGAVNSGLEIINRTTNKRIILKKPLGSTEVLVLDMALRRIRDEATGEARGTWLHDDSGWPLIIPDVENVWDIVGGGYGANSAVELAYRHSVV